VLKKTEALFAREQEARTKDETDVQWLAAYYANANGRPG
jgi:hypothetical protein